MKIELFHGDDRSAVVAGDAVIEYQRKTHRYESERAYGLIVTEQATYGERAAQAVIDHLAASRNR